MQRPVAISGIIHSSGAVSLVYSDKVSLIWDALVRLSWLASKPPRNLPVSASPALGLQTCTPLLDFFYVGYGDGTGCLCGSRLTD